MHEAINIIRYLSKATDQKLIILAGGINDMSILHRYPTRHVFPRTRVVRNLVNYTLEEMSSCVAGVIQSTNTPVALAMLSGLNLAAHSPSYHDLMYILQPCIDRAIPEINHQIRGINRLNNLYSPDLSSAVHRCTGHGGRYRTHYLQLIDGLHPAPALRQIWARNLQNYCARLFPDITHLQSCT